MLFGILKTIDMEDLMLELLFALGFLSFRKIMISKILILDVSFI